MVVPAAKVREICTASEVALVRNSRAPSINLLTPAELKQHAVRARKLYDKWLALSRTQARARSGKVGFGETQANTELKLQIFADALKNFDDKLANQKPIAVAGKPMRPKTKKSRNLGHRATRAEIREELSEIKEALKEPARNAAKKKEVKKVAVKKTASAPAKKSAAASAGKQAKKVASAKSKAKKKTAKKTAPASSPSGNPGLGFDKDKLRQAKTAAKQSRLDRSGVTTRMRGHVSARGKRSQGRRDSKG